MFHLLGIESCSIQIMTKRIFCRRTIEPYQLPNKGTEIFLISVTSLKLITTTRTSLLKKNSL